MINRFLSITAIAVACSSCPSGASANTPSGILAAVSAPAVAEMDATCTEPYSFKAFALLGDNADYAFAPGGSFETGAPGWSLNKAGLTSQNESLGIFGGARSLTIQRGGQAISPWFCVTPDHPTFRYVRRGGAVRMEIDYKVPSERDIDDKTAGLERAQPGWGPSAILPLAVRIPAHKLRKGVVARLVFRAYDTATIDNVLVDPYRRG